MKVARTARFPRPAGYHWDQSEPVIHPDGRKGCRWCKRPVPKGKRAWCGDQACIEEWTRRTAGQAGCRSLCEQRDRGVCERCRLDTNAVKAEWEAAIVRAQTCYMAEQLASAGMDDPKVHPATRQAYERGVRWSRPYAAIRAEFGGKSPESVGFCRRYGKRTWKALVKRRHLWEADHIVSIAERGDPFDPMNLRTLCLDCHGEATKALAGRLAARRKAREGR